MQDAFKVRVEELTRQNDALLCNRHNITSDFLQIWIKKYSTNQKVKKILDDIDDLID